MVTQGCHNEGKVEKDVKALAVLQIRRGNTDNFFHKNISCDPPLGTASPRQF